MMQAHMPSTLMGRSLVGLAFAILMLGCKPSGAQSESKRRPAPKPTAEQLLAATQPGYSSPSGTRQECLGRLVFDAAESMQWGIMKPGLWSGDRYRFTEKMPGKGDDLWVGNIQITVMAPATQADIQSMADEIDAKKDNGIFEYQTMIETDRRINNDRVARLADPSFQATAEEKADLRDAVVQLNKDIADIETRIANIQKDWHPLDPGIPGALAYAAGPDLYAYVLREGRAYKFLSASGEGQPKFEERERAFLDLLKRFQFRKLYEVPSVPGICVPYGFIPDDGRLNVRLAVSLRYADRPGVIYTLGTSVVGEEGVNGPEDSMLGAMGRAGAAGVVPGRDAQRMGPHKVKIGALEAYQGGVSLNVADQGKPAVRSYSVYTGYGGFAHSRVLPNITLDMRSFTREQEPTLEQNPPPVEESMARMDALLKSIRLRPTQPLMPELVGVKP